MSLLESLKLPMASLSRCPLDWNRWQWFRATVDDQGSANQRSGLPFHFFDNVDPNGMSAVLAALGDKLKTTLVVTVSKSGGTPEPHLGMEQARHRLEAHGGTWAGQAVAITMLDSKLDQQARDESWLQRFDMFDWVGGRTSITSAVGLLPGALIGCDIREFLAGAAQMDEATRVADLRRNPAALMAASWYVAGDGKGRRDMVVLPYRDRLEVFSRYLQQLVMESLGKRLDRDGNEFTRALPFMGTRDRPISMPMCNSSGRGRQHFATFMNVCRMLTTSL